MAEEAGPKPMQKENIIKCGLYWLVFFKFFKHCYEKKHLFSPFVLHSCTFLCTANRNASALNQTGLFHQKQTTENCCLDAYRCRNGWLVAYVGCRSRPDNRWRNDVPVFAWHGGAGIKILYSAISPECCSFGNRRSPFHCFFKKQAKSKRNRYNFFSENRKSTNGT